MKKASISSICRQGILAMLMLLMLLASLVMLPSRAQATSMNMYAWGLGSPSPEYEPTRVGEDYWIATATSSMGFFSISRSGHIYAWGMNRNHSAAGQGGIGGSEHLSMPTRVGNANNWTYISARSAQIAAINSNGELYGWGIAIEGIGLPDRNTPVRIGTEANWTTVSVGGSNAGNNFFHAINDQGELWAMGMGQNGRLGTGLLTAEESMVRIGDRTDWVSVSQGSNFALGLTQNGYLWAWGSNADGRTGLGVTGGNTLIPTRVGIAANWIDARTTNNNSGAINSSGELYTWGPPGVARGCGGSSGIFSSPIRVGSASNWRLIFGGNSHFIAVNADSELHAWGANSRGQLGLGDVASRSYPTLLKQVSNIGNLSRGGGERSLMMLRVLPGLPLTKVIDMPQGTTTPESRFDFSLRQVTRGQDDRYRLTSPATVTISDASIHFDEAGLATLTIPNILYGASFPHAGDFSFVLTEIPETNTLPGNETMIYSNQAFIVHVRVSNDIATGDPVPTQVIIYAAESSTSYGVTSWATDDDEDAKLEEIIFTNTFYRNLDDALSISKTVTGQFANLAQEFDFTIHLELPAQIPLADIPDSIVAHVVDSSTGNPVTPPQTVTLYPGTGPNARTFTTPVSTNVCFSLRHGQSLAFGTLPAGTTHLIVELQNSEYAGELVIRSGGQIVFSNTNFNTGVNVSGGTQIIADTGTNSAAFTNNHNAPPFTGLVITTSPLTLIVLGSVAIFALALAQRSRKRVELVAESS